VTFDTYRTLVFDEQGAGELCYGLMLVRNRMDELRKKHDPTSRTVLHSSYWPEQIFELIRWKAINESTFDNMLVGGNSPTTNPCLYLASGMHAFHGDGEMYTDDSESESSPTVHRQAKIAKCASIYPVSGYSDQQKAGKSSVRYFCEISRGCKNRCFYCQYGWLKSYRECNITDIEAALLACNSKTARIFAADRFQHTDFAAIDKLCQRMKISSSGSDLSVRFAAAHPELFQHTRKVRFGIDGLSERIRDAVGKKSSNETIVQAFAGAVDAGIKCFDIYMIYGFPGETRDDIADFDRLMRMLDPCMKGRTLAIHWNAFQPNAMTPLQWERPAIDKRLIETQKAIGDVRYAFKVMHKPLYTNPQTVAIRTFLARAHESFLPFARRIAFKPSIASRTSELRQACENAHFDPFAQHEIGAEMPWDRWVDYNKSTMERCAAIYRRKMGLAA
jgi:hypothetical protein